MTKIKISTRALEDWKKIESDDPNLFEKVKTVAYNVENEDTDSKKINLIQEAFGSFSKKEKFAIGAGLLLFGVPISIIAAALAISAAVLYGINSGIEKSRDAISDIKQKRGEKMLDGTILTPGSNANEKFINLLSENLRYRLLRSGSAQEDVDDFVEIKVSTVMDLLIDYIKLENNKENRELLINEVADNLGLSKGKKFSEILKEIGNQITHLMHVDRMEEHMTRSKDLTAMVKKKFAIHENLDKLEDYRSGSTRKLRCLIDRPYTFGEKQFTLGASNNLFNLRALPSLIKGPVNHNQVQFIANIFTNLITEGKEEIYTKKGAISAIDAIHKKVDEVIAKQEERTDSKHGTENNKWTDAIKEERLSTSKSHAHSP